MSSHRDVTKRGTVPRRPRCFFAIAIILILRARYEPPNQTTHVENATIDRMIQVFRLAALGALVAAGIHLAALAVPAFAAASYPPGHPAWRHVLFVAIDSLVAWLFLRRPAWFVWAYAVLTAQVIYGHGGGALASWQRDGRIAWIDAAALVAVPLALGLLVMDYRARTRTTTVT